MCVKSNGLWEITLFCLSKKKRPIFAPMLGVLERPTFVPAQPGKNFTNVTAFNAIL
jgi:hypothetical protein